MDESASKISETVKISEPSKPKMSRPLFGGKALTEDSNIEVLLQYEAEKATGDKGIVNYSQQSKAGSGKGKKTCKSSCPKPVEIPTKRKREKSPQKSTSGL